MCLCILKYIFVFVNVVLIKLGLAIVAAGVAILALLNNAQIEDIKSVGIFTIIVGAVFSAIFFCGCCGAMLKNNCLLITYTIIIFCFATTTVVITVIYSSNMTNIKDLIVNETAANLNDVQIWEPVLKCCGTTGPDSYEGELPITCCPDFGINNWDISQVGGSLNDLNIFTCTEAQAYKTGCVEVAGQYIQTILNIIQNILIGVDIAQIVMFLIAISLVIENRRRRRKGIY